jgi:hypothetical protein
MVRFQLAGLVCIWMFFVGQTVFSQPPEELVCGKIGGTWNCIDAYGHLTNTTAGCDGQGTCDPQRKCDRFDVYQWGQVNFINHGTAIIEDEPQPMEDELKAHIVVCLWNTFCNPNCEFTIAGWQCQNANLAIPIGGLDWYSVGPCGGGGGPGGPGAP